MGGCKCKGQSWEPNKLGAWIPQNSSFSWCHEHTQPLPWIGWIVWGPMTGPIEGVRSQTVCCFVGLDLQNLWWRTLQFVRCNAADPVTNTLFCCSCVVHFTTFQLVAGGTWQIRNPFFFFWHYGNHFCKPNHSWLIGLLIWVSALHGNSLSFFVAHMRIIYWLKTLCRWCPKPEHFVKDLCFLQSPKPTLDTPIGFEGFNFLLSLKADFWGKHTWSHDWPHNVEQVTRVPTHGSIDLLQTFMYKGAGSVSLILGAWGARGVCGECTPHGQF
jgi:hypothetical protein